MACDTEKAMSDPSGTSSAETSTDKTDAERDRHLANAGTVEVPAPESGLTGAANDTALAVESRKEQPGSVVAEVTGARSEPEATHDAGEAVAPSPGSEGPISAPPASDPEPLELEPIPAEPPPPPRLRKGALAPEAPKPLDIISEVPPPVWPPKVVGDLMTRRVIAIQQDDPIGELELWMQRFRFRHLPVVGEGMKLVGLISLTDLLHAELGVLPDGETTARVDATTRAGAIMRKNVVVARVDSPLETACRVMLKEKLACLPVVLEDERLVGIVTTTDFVRLALALLEAQSKEEPTGPRG